MKKTTNVLEQRNSFFSTLIFVAALALLSETGLCADGGQPNKAAGSGGQVPAGELPTVDKSKAKSITQPPAFDKGAATSLQSALEQPKRASGHGAVPVAEQPAVDKSKANPVQPPAFDKRAVTSLDAAPEQPKRVLGEGPVPAAEQRTMDKSGPPLAQPTPFNK